jgi:hypothetical protein
MLIDAKTGIGSAKDGKVTAFIPTPNAEIATPEGVGFDDAGNVHGSWTGKMAVRRWTKSQSSRPADLDRLNRACRRPERRRRRLKKSPSPNGEGESSPRCPPPKRCKELSIER